MQAKQKKILKRLGWAFVSAFTVMNFVAAFHAWKFTHFSPTAIKAVRPEQLSLTEKMGTLAFGVKMPRPTNDAFPTQPFESIKIKAEKSLEAWHIRTDSSSKGTVLLFHGYGGKKSGMIDKSDEFLRMGYNTLLVDFRGSGGSDGDQTTVGYKEAEEVKACFDLVRKSGEQDIVLFGTSMGAAAVMKAMNDYQLDVKAIVIECPFGTMYEATCARFRAMGVPVFPMARLIMFWGGLENGFWAYSHNPVEYAKGIRKPTLLLYGKQDKRVSRSETDAIFHNLQGMKALATYPDAGHENYLIKYREKWVQDVSNFLFSVGK